MTRSAHAPRRRTDGGQSIVEFALMFPFIMVMIFFFIEFGFAFNNYLTVTNAAAEAARYASVAHLPGTCNTDPLAPSVEGRAVNTSSNLVTCGEVSVRYTKVTVDPGYGRGDEVTVRIAHVYNMISPLGPMMSAFSFGTIPTTLTIKACSEARLEARPTNQALLVAGAGCN